MIVIIPAYEPDYRLENLVKSLKKEKNLKLIVVNDGSSSDEVFNKIKNDVIILKHDINLGKGIAMKTGLNYVLNNYSNEEIEKLYKNPNYLREKSSKIFEEAKSWTNNILFN